MTLRNRWAGLMVLSSLLLMAGCEDEENTKQSNDRPTDRSILFATIPADFFSGNYAATYALTGVYSNGDEASATLSYQSGSTTTHDSLSVNAIDEYLSLTNTTSGAVSSEWGESYYSTDLSDLHYLGNYLHVSGVSTTAISTTPLPLLAKIGDFGVVGSYSASDGTTISSSWALEDGYNGKAKLVITTIKRNAGNVLDTTGIKSWRISEDGGRVFVEVTLTFHQENDLTMSLSGYQN